VKHVKTFLIKLLFTFATVFALYELNELLPFSHSVYLKKTVYILLYIYWFYPPVKYLFYKSRDSFRDYKNGYTLDVAKSQSDHFVTGTSFMGEHSFFAAKIWFLILLWTVYFTLTAALIKVALF